MLLPYNILLRMQWATIQVNGQKHWRLRRTMPYVLCIRWNVHWTVRFECHSFSSSVFRIAKRIVSFDSYCRRHNRICFTIQFFVCRYEEQFFDPSLGCVHVYQNGILSPSSIHYSPVVTMFPYDVFNNVLSLRTRRCFF
jgi:hypothetical protein